MKIKFDIIPEDIRLMYDLYNKVALDGYVYVKIIKGMYGLKQAAILAYNNLVKHLKSHGYEPVPFTTGLWQHKTRSTKFCLCVDDFGVKYFSEDDANHLISSLKTAYNITTDIRGDNFCGLHLE
jgi:hypothetical protein